MQYLQAVARLLEQKLFHQPWSHPQLLAALARRFAVLVVVRLLLRSQAGRAPELLAPLGGDAPFALGFLLQGVLP
jgi:hypothetical protein